MNALKSFGFLAVVALSFSACSGSRTKTLVQQIAAPPVIDGNIDAAWNATDWLSISHVRSTRLPVVKPADIAAAYKILWDTANCYLLFRITDDIKFCSTYTTEFERIYDLRLREHDGINLMFDPENKKSSTLDTSSFNNKKFTYNSDSICTSTSTKANSVVKGISFAQSNTKEGYLFEISLPWKALNIVPVNNKEIGFEINIIDNDNYMPFPDTQPKKSTVLAWNDATGENPFTRTDIFGTLVLKTK